jgi:eukaryotic-like serine/threonine-protein kinase
MVLEVGFLLNNRYKILEVLGQGGMGSVYRAMDINLNVEVAVKDNFFTTDDYASQFRREAEILAKLRHTNLPRVTDHFVIHNQGQYLVMDYIEGEDLRQRMDRIGCLPEDEAITIGMAVCDALTYLETRDPPIVHRDIKPGNIKITPTGHIFLVDFGLVKTLKDSQITATGARAMTPGYSPPEQYGTARTDQRSDIYSLGATLYVALTGALPEDSLSRAMDQEKLTSIRNHDSQVSRRLASVIEKSLEIRPDDRYQSAQEFKTALLSARSITKRGADLVVEPPPVDRAHPPDMDESQELDGDAAKEGISKDTGSQEMEISRVNQSRTRRTLFGSITVVVVLVLAFLVVGQYWILRPSWAYQFSRMLFEVSQSTPGTPVAWYAPWLGGVTISIARTTPTGAIESTPTPATLVVDSPTPSSTRTFTPTPTASPEPTITPTHTFSPTPPPISIGGGSKIAFASMRSGKAQIYVVNVDDSGLVQITDMMEGACQPVWSPDGTKLVFISPCDGNKERYAGSALFIVNEDGSGLTPLPTVFGGDFDPAWSPDGKKIAFTSVRNSGQPEIWVINLESLEASRISQVYARDSQPFWSPDGSQIVFVSEREGNAQIWIMDADGSNQKRFSETKERFNWHPSWSSDRTNILFTQFLKEGGIPQLVLAPYVAERYQEFRLITQQGPMLEGRFSPDGFWVTYEGWPTGSNHDIFIMTINGSERRALASHPDLDFHPAWRPVP